MVFLIVLLILPLYIYVSATAMSWCWFWFIVPTFGAHVLTLPQAAGIALMVSFATYQHNHADESDESEERLIGAIVTSFLRPMLLLGVGFVISRFM